MPKLIYCLRASLSAAIWRRFDPLRVSARIGHLVALVAACAALAILLEWAAAGSSRRFQLYGINSTLALAAIGLAVTALVASRKAALAELVILYGLFLFTSSGLLAMGLALERISGHDDKTVGVACIVAFAAYLIWLVGAIRCVFVSFEVPNARRPTLRAVALVIGCVLAGVALPNWPTFTGKDFERSGANVWEMLSAYRASQVATEEESSNSEDGWAAVELVQPTLVDRAVAGLATRTPGQANVYVVGVAGWSRQNVFLSEINGSLGVVGERLGTKDRTVRLVNHGDTASDTPIATVSSLADVLLRLAKTIDVEHDIVMLVITSHGNKSGVALEYGSLVYRMLSPAILKSAFEQAGIKNRVVIVSACHSGVFIPAFSDDNSAVVTASSARATSFGCSNDREWTYFGDAFFNHALRQEPTLAAAFSRARQIIGEWEARDGLTPSEPQIHIGSAIAAKLPFLGAPTEASTSVGRQSAVE